ncbi:MAG: hypothetical protein V5A39_08565 [Haloarculaceae archaeon]
MSASVENGSEVISDLESENIGSDSFVGALRDRTGVGDVGALLSVPAVLVVLYLLPSALRRSLAFEYTDPSLLTAFAANFVHLDGGHLLVNLAIYALVVPVLYALSVTSGSRQRFYTAFLTFVVVFPFVLSYLNLAVVRPAFAVGFSGVTMAFVGSLPFAVAESLDARFDVGPTTAVAPALFFFTLALISVLSVRSVIPEDPTVLLGISGLALAAVLSALLYAVVAYDRGEQFRAKLSAAAGAPGYFEVVVVGLLLVLALPFVAFPADPVTANGVLNLYVHLLGYALGFIVTYATAAATTRFFEGSPL